jgi:hypothetical protein
MLTKIPDVVEYDVTIDCFLLKDGILKTRLLWNLDNQARTRFQKTISDASPFFDNPEFHTAVKKSLNKQYEKSGSELAQKIYQTISKVRSTHQLLDCLICMEPLMSHHSEPLRVRETQYTALYLSWPHRRVDMNRAAMTLRSRRDQEFFAQNLRILETKCRFWQHDARDNVIKLAKIIGKKEEVAPHSLQKVK